MWVSLMDSHKQTENKGVDADPYCECWIKRTPVQWKQMYTCSCGEENNRTEWKWECIDGTSNSSVVLNEDKKRVTFHPFYSSGTAAIKGDTPLEHNHHYYWEVKMLTETYGTDIMVGLGSNKMIISNTQFKFTSLLGQDNESYGLSYLGGIRHNASVSRDCVGFCKGSIIGVRVDMWSGTLEFYINRKPQGISFHNLRRHEMLYPMLCSTAAQSSMRLTYAASWRASLLVDAVKILARSVSQDDQGRHRLPPGLWHTLKSHFWMTLPTRGCILDENELEETIDSEPVTVDTSTFSEVIPSPYINGFYVDNVERDYRIVVWQ